MPKHVAFLRAINVGGRRIQMGRLCELFEAAGLADVDSYLASGNIVFTSDEAVDLLEARIEAHLQDTLGYTVETFVRTLDELGAIAQTSHFAEQAKVPRTKRYVVFLKNELSEEAASTLAELQTEVDRFAIEGRELYWLRHIDAGESQTTGAVSKAVDAVATRRTFTTVERLLKKFA